MPGFFGQIFRFLLKLVLGLLAATFAVSLLLAALIVVTLSLLKSLITGRKPAPAMVFSRFQKFSAQGVWPKAAPKADASKRAGDIVDVEAREIRDDERVP